jgi:putative transposase
MTKKIDDDLIDALLKGRERPEDLPGNGGLMHGPKRAVMQRMLGAELTDHLGHEPGETPPPVRPNRRNGTGRKTVKGEAGSFGIDVPRDREGGFEPRLIGKGRTRIDGLDDKSEPRGRHRFETPWRTPCMRAACACGTSGLAWRTSAGSKSPPA